MSIAKLTKREALELTRELWQWLALTGARSKRSWPKRRKLSAWGCFCCDYADQTSDDDDMCLHCPLVGKWSSAPYAAGNVPCCQTDSPYDLWAWGSDEDRRKKYAAQIVKLCDEALAELKDD